MKFAVISIARLMKCFFSLTAVFIMVPTDGIASSLMFQSNLERTGVYNDVGPEAPPRLAWKFNAGSAVFSTPLVYEGVVYFVSFEGGVYAVSEKNGSLIWEKQLGGNPDFQITMNDDLVLIGYHFNEGDGGYLMALDRLSGEELWRFIPNLNGIASSTIYNETAITTTSKDLYSLSIKTGKEIWRQPISGGSKHPVIDKSSMYYQDESQAIYSISIESGDIQWKYSPEFTKRFAFSTPAMDTCCIYALIGDRKQGGIVKLNRHNGSKIAFFPVGPLGFMSSVSLADGVVFFGDDGEGTRGSHGHMNAIDIENGKLIWRFETGGFVRGTASIAGNTVYFGSADHYMYAVNRYTGEMKWRYKTDGIVNSTPAIVNGRLYFGSIDGHLYVLE